MDRTAGSLTSGGSRVVRTGYNYAVGYLRGTLVVLVVVHHSLLAYYPHGPKPPRSLAAVPRWWEAFPVVDSQQTSLAAQIVGFNDRFFMALLFFLSGLFVWRGLVQRGGAGYLRARLMRLGIPFAVGAGLLAPLAYYPTYLQMPGHTSLAGFRDQWLSLGNWPAGPVWFLWVLFVFDCVAAVLWVAVPGWGERAGRAAAVGHRRPGVCFAALLAISLVVYVPLAWYFTPLHWSVSGPFFVQTSRLVLYLTYFLSGVAVGAWGLERGMLAPEGALARRWPVWTAGALVMYAAAAAIPLEAVRAGGSPGWMLAYDAGLAASCAASGFGFLSLFVRFVRGRIALLDSLSSNSFAIYLVHYGLVSWLQLALVPWALPALLKAALVLVGAVVASWSVAASLRRIPAVARII